jgi:hypothetical protein
MSDTLTTNRPKPKRRVLRKIDAAMRQRIEAAIERMIEALDAIDAPGEDREEDEEGDELEINEGEDLEGDELDSLEVADLEISGEADGDRGDCVDDEPSLGSLDRRMSQTKWAQPDYTPRGVWGLCTDAEDDGLVRGEYDDADHEGGIEDLGHDEAGSVRRPGFSRDEMGVTWPPIGNANDTFGVA